MSKFVLTGFSDEIMPELEKQVEYLKKFDMKYFEIRGIGDKNISAITDEEAAEVKRYIDANGIKVSSIGSPIGKIKITDPFDEHMEILAKMIRFAKLFDTKYIRIFSFYIPEGEDYSKYRDEVMARMKKMCDLAEKEDVILLHENEKGIYGDIAPRCKDILETIKSPNLRAVFDPANFVECGQKVYPDAYEMLEEYIEYMHIKDSLGKGKMVPSGEGIGSIKDVLSSLYKRGYEGFLSLEPHLHLFWGLKNLQSEELDVQTDGDGPTLFKVAKNALEKIINEIEK